MFIEINILEMLAKHTQMEQYTHTQGFTLETPKLGKTSNNGASPFLDYIIENYSYNSDRNT